METPRGWGATLELRNRTSAPTRWNGVAEFGSDEFGGVTRRVSGELSFRPGPRWQLSLAPYYLREINPRQYVVTQSGGGLATYGSRYIFSFTDRATLSAQTRLNFTLKPDLNLDIYAEPFAASGRYYDFGELLAPRSRFLRVYGTEGTQIARLADSSHLVRDGDASFVIAGRDFNVRSFRSTWVVRWEWRPGSTLYLVWQQDRFGTEVSNGRVGVGDLFGSLSARGDNRFVVKTSFWLPVK